MMNLPNGWFSDEDIREYRRLANRVPVGGTIAELGVWMGRSLCSIADIIKDRKLNVIVVDTFRGTVGEEAHKGIQNLREDFEKNMKDFGIETEIYEMTTNEASEIISDKCLDLCFIDARHDYEGIKEDIDNWLPKVRGTIAGHDYSTDWGGVMKSVNEHFNPSVGGAVWSHNKQGILAYISTKGRYDILHTAMLSIALQTKSPDEFRLYDDNLPSERKDLRDISICQHIFKLMDEKGIKWSVEYGEGKGQHFNHQRANLAGYTYCYRLDDDEYAEEGVLETLYASMSDDVGAVGGLVLVPQMALEPMPEGTNNKIETFFSHPNLQWFRHKGKSEVDHLTSSFLYRAGIANYNLNLSSVAHTEETQFTYGLKLKGYKIIVDPKAVTWHFREPKGGIRDGQKIDNWKHDEELFNSWLEFQKSGKKLYVLNNGLGDHFMFRQVIIPEKDSIIACCYPDVFPEYNTISISEAMKIVNIEDYNVYKWCGEHNWKGHLKDAFLKLYENLN